MIDIHSIFTDLLHTSPSWNRRETPMPPRALPDPGTTFTKPAQLQTAIKDLQSLVNVYDKNLRFHLSEGLDRVIVKVVNNTTEEIIKEIPSELVQQMLLRVREALGAIIDYRV